MKREDGFGELALLYNSPRSSSVKAVEDSTLWTIDRYKFKRAVEDVVLKIMRRIENSWKFQISTVSIFT